MILNQLNRRQNPLSQAHQQMKSLIQILPVIEEVAYHIIEYVCSLVILNSVEIHEYAMSFKIFISGSSNSNVLTMFSSTSHKEEHMFKGIIRSLLPIVGNSVSTLILSASRGLTR